MKEMQFYIDTPSIQIGSLSKNDDFLVNFDLNKDGFEFRFGIGLDKEHLQWNSYDGENEILTNCNSLIVTVSTESIISEAQFLESTYFLVIEYLIIFFNYVQVELGQYWVDIGFISDWDLLTFLEKTIKKQSFAEGEGRILIPIGGYSEKRQIPFSPKRRAYPEKSKGLDVKQIPEIKFWFEEHKVPDLSMLLLATSKRLLLHGDYRLSSILAVTALEAPLKAFVKKRCKIKKISRNCETVSCNLNKLYSILESNELTDWVQKWLGPRWDGDTVSGNQIVSCAIEFNKKRNGAIHEGITPDFDAVDQGIFVVEALCEFIKKAI